MATKVGYDMESIAIDVKTNLRGQSIKMQKIGGNLNDIQMDTNVANRQMNEIKKQRSINRLILYGVIAALILAVVIVLLTKFL